MRVLVLLSSSPKKAILIKLHTDELIRELKSFLSKRNMPKAINMALAKGKLEKTLNLRDIHITSADLILTKDAVRWDLTSKEEKAGFDKLINNQIFVDKKGNT